MNNKNSQGCPNVGDFLENRQLRHELDRERKRREDAEKSSSMNLLCGLAAGAFFAGMTTFVIMSSGMEHETAEAFDRLFASCAALFFAFAALLVMIRMTLSCIIWWHNERKKQKIHSKKEDGTNV